MTQYREDSDRISNWFDAIERGIAPRGCSFTDLDGVSHDGATGRFLVREFKRPGAPVPKGQSLTLRALSRLPQFTVLVARQTDDNMIEVAMAGSPFVRVTIEEYRRLIACWWENKAMVPVASTRDYGVEIRVGAFGE